MCWGLSIDRSELKCTCLHQGGTTCVTSFQAAPPKATATSPVPLLPLKDVQRAAEKAEVGSNPVLTRLGRGAPAQRLSLPPALAECHCPRGPFGHCASVH